MGSSRIRSIVGLVVVALVLGAFTLSPVAAHFTTNTRHLGKHAWQQFIKQKVNKQFQKKCKNGSVLAWVWIDASVAKTGPDAYTTLGVGPFYNCAGGQPRILSGPLATGLTYIQFPGITNTLGGSAEAFAHATIAECGVGCIDRGQITADTITDAGRVVRVSTQNDTGAAADYDLFVTIYGKGVATSPTSAEAVDTAADRA